MSSTANRRRIPVLWLLILVAVAIAAVVVAAVVAAGGDSGPEKTDTIQVGEAPAAVAIGGGTVWVASNSAGVLVRVNPGSKKAEGRPVRVGEAPEYATFGEGSIWVTSGL